MTAQLSPIMVFIAAARGWIFESGSEWFNCTVEQIRSAILTLKRGELNVENRDLDFDLRPEQAAAIEK
ncbi:MAG: hypothetical protein R3C44_10280 [Chloroflexota bacterium]